MSNAKFTPGPWEYVESTKHHGPYVTTEFGSTICDCYTMSDCSSRSVINGGKSRPILFLAEMADPNARLIACAPELYEWLEYCLGMVDHGHGPPNWDEIRKVLAKARGETK